MEKANIGNKLKQLRQNRSLTMDMFVADLKYRYNIEVNKGQVSRWENNENDPSLFVTGKIADYYGVSVDYLLDLCSESTPPRLLMYAKEAKKIKEGNV